jgi:hypothetical protein
MKLLFVALMAGWMVLVANANAEDIKNLQCDQVDADGTVATQDTAPAKKADKKEDAKGKSLKSS